MNNEQNFNMENQNDFVLSQTAAIPEDASSGQEGASSAEKAPRFSYKKSKAAPSSDCKVEWKPTPPVRRVGTLTMGFSLIAAGVVALITIFNPDFNLSLAFKLSPVIFILLGTEILIGSIRHKGERIRFDFLSGFICFCLVCGAGVLALAGAFMPYLNPQIWIARDRIEYNTSDELVSAVCAVDAVSDAGFSVNLPPYAVLTGSINDPDTASLIQVYWGNVDLIGPYDSKESFAQDCLRVLEALEGYPYRISNLSINWRDEQPAQNGTVRVQSYELHINRPSIRNLSLDAISKQVMSEQYFVSADTGEAVFEESTEGMHLEIEAIPEESEVIPQAPEGALEAPSLG